MGAVIAYPGNGAAPDGWMLCDGSAINRGTYSSLFSVIGTTYGPGDGSTTFALPNLIDKFVEGSATAGTVKAAGLPDIKGAFNIRAWFTTSSQQGFAISGASGSFRSSSNTSSGGGIGASGTGTTQKIDFDASNSSPIYGASTTVQPPAVTMRYLIYTGVTNKRKWLRTA